MDRQIVKAFTLVRRNRMESPFPGKMTAEEKARHFQWVRDALEETEGFRFLDGDEAARWCGRHPFFAKLSKGGHAVLMDDSGLSVIADGEDGVIFCFDSDTKAAEAAFHRAENRLFSSDGPAKTEKFGCLTARPVLSGLAVQHAIVLHLPVLRTLKQLRAAAETVKKMGCEMLPAGEEENNAASLYAVVNIKGTAENEEAIRETVRRAAQTVSEKESMLAARMLASKTSRLADEAERAYGVLKYARRLSAQEWRTMWSKLRMGAEQGLFNIPLHELDAILMPVLYPGTDETENNKQVLRARMARRFLKGEHHADLRKI